MMKKLSAAIIGITSLFATSCVNSHVDERIYVDNESLSIIFLNNPDSAEDGFFMRIGVKDDELGATYLTHRGIFSPESVDKAVDQYLEDGSLPARNDLE